MSNQNIAESAHRHNMAVAAEFAATYADHPTFLACAILSAGRGQAAALESALQSGDATMVVTELRRCMSLAAENWASEAQSFVGDWTSEVTNDDVLAVAKADIQSRTMLRRPVTDEQFARMRRDL